jgi:signal transduction histidine kinase
MAGEFGMTSETGVGSTFWFRLPLERESRAD